MFQKMRMVMIAQMVVMMVVMRMTFCWRVQPLKWGSRKVITVGVLI